jgi:hypothetical protein
MTTNSKASAQRKAHVNDRSFNFKPPPADPLASRSLMEARAKIPAINSQRPQYSIQESSSHRVNSLASDHSTADNNNPTSKRIESISSKFNSLMLKREEYPHDLLKELEYENPFVSRKHSVKKVFTNAAGRSISPLRLENSILDQGEDSSVIRVI